MNPQNIGQNIPLRHSLLWRKPLVYEKPVPESKLCHLQVNQLAKTGELWRTRNVQRQIETRYSRRKNQKSPQNKKANLQQAPQNNSLIIQLSEQNLKGRQLVESMSKMKKQKLVQAGGLTLAAYPAVGKLNFVYNDYHPKPANAGYSRNMKGKHFTS